MSVIFLSLPSVRQVLQSCVADGMTDGWDVGVQILRAGRPALTHMASTFGDAATNVRLLRSMRAAVRDASLNRAGIIYNSREVLWKEGKDLTAQMHIASS